MIVSSADERRSPRAKVMLTATIGAGAGSMQVRVDDLSAYGARVFGDLLLPLDTPVTFRCKNLAVKGFVAWVDGRGTGIGFGEAVEPQQALRTVKSPRPTVARDFRRPGFRERVLTAAERQYIADWATSERTRLGE